MSLSRVKQTVFLFQRGFSRRTLIDSSVSIPPLDFLLQEIDLPKADPDFLQVVSKQHFLKKYGEKPPLLKVFTPISSVEQTLRRIIVTLPLHLNEGDGIIPIPFIIDTGAPNFAYLGSGALIKLRDAKAIQEIVGLYAFLLQGKVCRGEVCVKNPPVSILPIHYEELSVRGDPRLNVLGLSGLHQLKMNLYLS